MSMSLRTGFNTFIKASTSAASLRTAAPRSFAAIQSRAYHQNVIGALGRTESVTSEQMLTFIPSAASYSVSCSKLRPSSCEIHRDIPISNRPLREAKKCMHTSYKVYSTNANARHQSQVGSFPKAEMGEVGTGLVGAPACGDVMKLQIKVDDKGIISDVRFKTFGCGSAIASSSYMTERVKGLSLEEAGKIRNTEIAKELSLPPVK